MTDEEEFKRDIITAPRSVYKALTYRDEQIAALLADVERLRGLEEENAAIRELLSDAYDSWFYGEEASYSSPPWVDRAMALLGKEGTR